MQPRDWPLPYAVMVLLAVVATLGAPAAWAARPLDTEDTATVPSGGGEVELSINHARRGAEGAWALHAVLSVGLLPRAEARVESEIAALVGVSGRDDQAGLGDSLIGLKLQLLDERELTPAVLGAVAVRLPTGAHERGLGAPRADVTALFALGKTLGAFTLTWNGGYTFVTADRDADAALLALSLEYRASRAWTVGGEVVSSPRFAAGATGVTIVRAGAIYAVTERLKIDGAVGAGITRGAPDIVIAIGMTLRVF